MNGKNKLYILGGGLLLLTLCAYFFSIKNTFNLLKDNKIKEQKLSTLQSAPTQIATLKNQLSTFKTTINQKEYDREEIFKSINSFCTKNNLKLGKFYPEIREQSNDLEIIIDKIEVEGTYKNMVKLAYEIEHTQELGQMASLNFEKRKDRRNKRDFLIGELYLRNLVSN